MAHDAFGDVGSLDAIFHPTTVAVVGASAEPDTLGYKTLAALTSAGFEGSIVAVHWHQQGTAFGVRVYREFEDVPAPVDLAVVVATSDEIPDAIERCARAGVKGVVVASRLEATPERRRDFEYRVRDRLRQSRMKLIGPGCCALMNPSLGLNVSPGLPMPVAGNVALIGQSGSLATAIIDWSHKGIVGFSAFARSATWSTSAGAISSTTSAAIGRRARFSFRWNRSPTCARSCPRPARSRCRSRLS